MRSAHFNETQKFRQPWIIVVIFSSIAVWAYIIIYGVFFEERPDKFSTLSLIISSLVLAGMTFLLFQLKLETRIRKEGIYYRFFPLHLKEKHIPRDEVLSYEVRKYRPIAEYGGWGVRFGGKKHGRAFNVSGNMGLQLYLKDDKKILFGTRKPHEIGKAMEKMMQGLEMEY
ncbi:MAG TPA: hypothetical protein VK994_06660 [Bacteroidales bacterium]|nr:hypothetical protein [Bacteroidales bacterium]